MPGLSGLETLGRIKLEVPDIPVIMITKNEEENIMDQAVGQKIADYLIKPGISRLTTNYHSNSLTIAEISSASSTDVPRLTGSDTTSSARRSATGRESPLRQYHNIYMGLNSRMDPVQAAMLRVKLAAMDHENSIRRERAGIYDAHRRHDPSGTLPEPR